MGLDMMFLKSPDWESELHYYRKFWPLHMFMMRLYKRKFGNADWDGSPFEITNEDRKAIHKWLKKERLNEPKWSFNKWNHAYKKLNKKLKKRLKKGEKVYYGASW